MVDSKEVILSYKGITVKYSESILFEMNKYMYANFHYEIIQIINNMIKNMEK